MALKDKALKTADPAALIIGGLVAIAGALGLWSKLQLSVDAVQALQGGLQSTVFSHPGPRGTPVCRAKCLPHAVYHRLQPLRRRRQILHITRFTQVFQAGITRQFPQLMTAEGGTEKYRGHLG